MGHHGRSPGDLPIDHRQGYRRIGIEGRIHRDLHRRQRFVKKLSAVFLREVLNLAVVPLGAQIDPLTGQIFDFEPIARHPIELGSRQGRPGQLRPDPVRPDQVRPG